MKKRYEAPSVEKIAFDYRDQVVAESGNPAVISEGSGNFWESSELGSCYSGKDIIGAAMNLFMGDCSWLFG